MLLKYMKHEVRSFLKLKYTFAQPPKKRTEAPRYTKPKEGDRIDPTKVNYNVVPQQLRKGVKAYVQATNILVSSQAELEAITLKEIILQERDKFKSTLDQMGETPAKKPESQTQKEENLSKVEQNHYDLMKAIKLTSNISNFLMIANIAGYGLLNTQKQYEYLGFFLGLSLNPSIITLTGLAIGFNAASWIIIQSLHLSIRDPNQLTLDKISLTNCSPLMYLEALSIAAQTAGLSYYLMQPQPYVNMPFLIGSFALAQTQLVYSIIRATGGYKFEYFSKILLTQITASLIIGVLTFSLFGKISEYQNLGEYDQTLGQYEVATLDQNVLIKRGYDRFLSEFKQKDYAVVKGETINKLTIEQTK